MAKDSKFGTFAGVFTPSLLTILGVIMYLRLPWVIGNAGLYRGLAIIATAHVISICTGLSISSIATDKRVGAGGPYYIVSRTLGLPIGGTLGVALFLGLSFSISLYVIGFSESFLSFAGIEPTRSAIRICGTVTLAAVTAVTFISTAFAIKSQYFVMALIGASLLSVFLGGSEPAPAAPQLEPAAGAPDLAVLFAIFFPAVTGFTAGVNMSGDLRDPRRSIPRGTIAAIFVGMAIYTGMALFVAFRVEPGMLVGRTDVLKDVALVPGLVLAGIWGATLSSALGSILGAPRILQALASDRLTHRVFAKGYGKSNEPRNALLLAFAIGEAGILIAELDSIARVVSMVFLTMYAFLNFTCAIESWASPDFRPAFRIPRFVSILGAATSVLVMIQLDLVAMLGATVFLVSLFTYLKRKQLSLDSGDAWEGIWFSLIRSGLYRLSKERLQKRNWRPNVLLFRPAQASAEERLHRIARSVISGSGMLTDVELEDLRAGSALPSSTTPETQLGVFRVRHPCGDPYEAIESICRYHGLGHLRPNTVLLPFSEYCRDPDRFASLSGMLAELDLNVLAFAHNPDRKDATKRVDVWWRPGCGNLTLSIALVRFIGRTQQFVAARTRVLLVSTHRSQNDYLRATARRMLEEARVDADIEVLSVDTQVRSFEERVREESSDALLTIVGLDEDSVTAPTSFQAHAEQLVRNLGDVLFLRAASTFQEDLDLGRQPSISFIPPTAEDGRTLALPEVELPEPPALARAVAELAEQYQEAVGALHEQGLKVLYGQNIQLLRSLKASVDGHLGGVEEALVVVDAEQQQRLLSRAFNGLWQECQGLFDELATKQVAAQRGLLEASVASFSNRHFLSGGAGVERLRVQRALGDVQPDGKDAPQVRRVKRRRRLIARLTRRPVTYDVIVTPLKRFYFNRAVREILGEGLRAYVVDSHRLAVSMGKALTPSAAAAAFATLDTETLRESVVRCRESLLANLEDLVTQQKSALGERQWALLAGARNLMQAFAEDVDRLDFSRFVKRERKVRKVERAVLTELSELPAAWSAHQQALVARAQLAMTIAKFQHAIAALGARTKAGIEIDVERGTLRTCEAVLKALAALSCSLSKDEDVRPELTVRAEFERRVDTKHLVDDLIRQINELLSELPDTIGVLTDDAVRRLEEGETESAETTELPIRRLVQFLSEAEFIGALQEALSNLSAREQRVSAVAQDAVRLTTFNINEILSMGETRADALRTQLDPIISSAIDRIDAELAPLLELGPNISDGIDERIKLVLDKTNPYELTAIADKLEQHIRLHQGRRAVSGARSLARRTAERARQTMVGLLYGRSAGVVLARGLRTRASARDTIVDSILALVGRSTPRPRIAESLPFYYRQLFVGQSAVNDAFWVGRSDQLAKAEVALSNQGRGKRGALLVTGERGSGKSALCQRILDRYLTEREVFRVAPVPGGSADPAAFRDALSRATGVRGDPAHVIQQLPERSVVVIDDLELWWERTHSGMAVVGTIIDLVARHGDRCLFLIATNRQAFTFLNRIRPLADHALAVLECGPFHAEELKRIVLSRHGSTGMRFELDGKPEDGLGDWRLARLFTGHFDYSNGYVGPALRSWVTHIEDVHDKAIAIRMPVGESWEPLDEIDAEWIALLLQFILHKHLSHGRLRRITGLEGRKLDRDIDTLKRIGLVLEERQGVLQIDPFVQQRVIDRLIRRGLAA